MLRLFLISILLQTASAGTSAPPTAVRGDRFQINVPQGWRTLLAGDDVVLEHTSGASLLVRRIAPTRTLAAYSRQQAERVMAPLGFAKLGEPQSFDNAHDEWVQYEITGNRGSEHRRVLYRAMRRDTGYFEFVFEAGEDRFAALLTDAQTMADSIRALLAQPPAVRRKTARR